MDGRASALSRKGRCMYRGMVSGQTSLDKKLKFYYSVINVIK